MTQDPAAATATTTKQRLLSAAREEFAAHGIAGARVDRIAELAGVNKERIYGYFGSKQKLFDQVVSQALDELAEAVPLRPGDDPAEYVGRVYDFHRANPVLVRLSLWEGLHYRDGALPNEEHRATHYERKVAALAETFGTEVSPQVTTCLLGLIALAAWPSAVPQMSRLILGAGPRPDLRAQLVEFARRAVADSLPAGADAGAGAGEGEGAEA
ncbi:TetR family transcriptional regulator [Kitasatospora phosalacinea]|uniref:TetR family transcriptional regulator n=1 Tax=Kitasatospora phosalacinea TaxID=2065 RepID=UPI003663EEC7